jgi:hypothetical protein
MYKLIVITAFFLAACANLPTSPPINPQTEIEPKQPTCAEEIVSEFRRQRDIELNNETADKICKLNNLNDWTIVDAENCSALTDSMHILFPDGSLYYVYNPSKLIKTSADVQVLMAKVYKCRMKFALAFSLEKSVANWNVMSWYDNCCPLNGVEK